MRARIPEYLIGQTADDIEELSEAVVYYKNDKYRSEAQELLVQAVDLIREANKLVEKSNDEE